MQSPIIKQKCPEMPRHFRQFSSPSSNMYYHQEWYRNYSGLVRFWGWQGYGWIGWLGYGCEQWHSGCRLWIYIQWQRLYESLDEDDLSCGTTSDILTQSQTSRFQLRDGLILRLNLRFLISLIASIGSFWSSALNTSHTFLPTGLCHINVPPISWPKIRCLQW